MKKLLKGLALVLAALLLVVLVYVAYVFLRYDRLDDNLELVPAPNATQTASASGAYTVVSWNLGFGAYSADYSFFMDGGSESRARSESAVRENLGSALTLLAQLDADFCFLEEIDVDATRSYHVDERALVLESLADYGAVFAQNYDSPYLFYPILEPHGASKAGMLTLSKYEISGALRRSLPVESGFMKLLDLDRCYSVSRVPLDNGAELCLYCVHLSAYTSDGTIAVEQLKLLLADLQAEFDAGNYVVCGGDFNKDLLGDSASIFGVASGNATWAQAFPTELLTADLQLVAPFDEEDPVPSCRNADRAYVEGESFVLTIDGFLVSNNVTVEASSVLDTGFAWSDHNPVVMTFSLNG